MKMLLLTCCLFSSLALAAPPEFKGAVVGDFTVQDEFQISFHRRYETVFTDSEEGRMRLEELKAQNYSCIEYNPPKVMCGKVMNDLQEVPAALVFAVQKKWGSLLISLRDPIADPKLEFYSDFYSQWNVEQKVLVRAGVEEDPEVYYDILYSVTKPDKWKILIGDQLGKSYSFIYENEKTLRVEDQFIVYNGKLQDNYSVVIGVEKLK